MVFDREIVYNVIYALAARDGREAALFGNSSPLALEAFMRTPMSDDFPELWFEIPLLGDPWFDLHVLTSRNSLCAGQGLGTATTERDVALFRWLAAAEGARQIAFSWDTGSGHTDEPAIQLLTSTWELGIACGFLETVGRPDAIDSHRAFRARIPSEWFPCYSGVFPSRPDVGLRIECIPGPKLQHAYAQDAELLERHLRQAGLSNLGDTIVQRCHELSQQPFPIEFQFNVRPDGSADTTFSVSSRFSTPPGSEEQPTFETAGAAGTLMQKVEQWGLADERWKLLEDAAFAKRFSRGSSSTELYCFPMFLKLRWRDGEPLDAKAYFIAGTTS